jgi:hypothetical protein
MAVSMIVHGWYVAVKGLGIEVPFPPTHLHQYIDAILPYYNTVLASFMPNSTYETPQRLHPFFKVV